MNKKLSFVSARAQSVVGTAVSVTPATDYIQFSEFEIEHNQYMDNVKILTGNFTSEPEVPGNAYVTCKGKIPFVSAGQVLPQCDLVLKAAGFTLYERVDAELGSQYIYTRSGDTVDLSMCKYDFKDTSARIRSINSVMFTSLKIIMESGKVPMLEFTGQGLLGGNSVAYETIGTVTKPTQSKISYYSVNDFTSDVLSTEWELVKADVEIINKITHKPVMTGYGYAAPEITDQESKFNFTVLADTEIDQPLSRVGDDGTVSFVFGSVPGRRVRVQGSRGQLLSTKDSTNGDLISHDVSGKYIDNSLVVTFNYDLLPEFEYQDTDGVSTEWPPFTGNIVSLGNGVNIVNETIVANTALIRSGASPMTHVFSFGDGFNFTGARVTVDFSDVYLSSNGWVENAQRVYGVGFKARGTSGLPTVGLWFGDSYQDQRFIWGGEYPGQVSRLTLPPNFPYDMAAGPHNFTFDILVGGAPGAYVLTLTAAFTSGVYTGRTASAVTAPLLIPNYSDLVLFGAGGVFWNMDYSCVVSRVSLTSPYIPIVSKYQDSDDNGTIYQEV